MISDLKTLIIDNYDSYTFNLLQFWDSKSLENVVVIRNDQVNWEFFLNNLLPYFDNIIISPGPGRPENPADFGICSQLLQSQSLSCPSFEIPILGICLGHQGIAYNFGARVEHASRIMHGRLSEVWHNENTEEGDENGYGNLLNGLPNPFWAVRYHSLVVEPESLPQTIIQTAFAFENDADIAALQLKYPDAHFDTSSLDAKDSEYSPPPHPQGTVTTESLPKTIMAFQHCKRPLWGVQFHPESICTEHGRLLIRNFLMETIRWITKLPKSKHKHPRPALPPDIRAMSVVPSLQPRLKLTPRPTTCDKFELIIHDLGSDIWVDPALLFDVIKNSSITPNNAGAAWLDSAMSTSPYSTFSYLAMSPALTLTYATLHRELCATYCPRGTTAPVTTTFQFLPNQSTNTQSNKLRSPFFSYLSSLLANFHGTKTTIKSSASNQPTFEFCGGLIGYIGYELKRETLPGYSVPKEQKCFCPHITKTFSTRCCRCKIEPDAALHLIDKFLVLDPAHKRVWACCLVRNGDGIIEAGVMEKKLNVAIGMERREVQGWIHEVGNIMREASDKEKERELQIQCKDLPYSYQKLKRVETALPNLVPLTTPPDYLTAIGAAISQIREGESYEICLTTAFTTSLPNINGIPLPLYTNYLRSINPSPFSALLSFPSTISSLTIMSSSPERFLKVTDEGVVEMKPIKGTISRARGCFCQSNLCDSGMECEKIRTEKDIERARELWGDVKERGENLMIVDLIRNDLAQVCDPTTITVPKLICVESYPTVHTLVSTVRGQLRPDLDCVAAFAGCFPPGSMTGAPKLRSVQILDILERHRPRGVYSGCIGYFSWGNEGNECGTADFSVVIRTGVLTMSEDGQRWDISIGAGGAITFLSDPEKEWDEVLLKSRSVVPSVSAYLSELGQK